MNLRLKILNSIKGRLNSFMRIWLRCLNTFYERKNISEGCLLVNAWVEYRFGKILHRNWGDELNIYMLETLTGKHVVSRADVFVRNKINYLFIGSIIEDFADCHSIIWGSGAMYGGNFKLKYKPAKVCAVRGPKTRQYLLSQGIECPQIYGDPALLLPFLYKPSIVKKFKIGIIAHIDDATNPVYKSFLNKYCDCVCFIDLKNYAKWHDIIDKINSCNIILSSSLHGLIVSDAYNIPNIWLKSFRKLSGDDFKFHDYFLGVDRNVSKPFELTTNTTVDYICNLAKSYVSIKVDYASLIKSCPFKINLKCFQKYL